MRDKKEYDRARAASLYEDFKDRKERLVNEVFGGKCFLCEEPGWSGYHFHHLRYHKTESLYPRDSKAMSTRLRRLEEAEKHPGRFKVLCGRCHRLVEFVKCFMHDKKRFQQLI